MACEAAVQADPGWQEAMRKRGVEDFSLAMVDPWAAGYTGPEDGASERRILRPLTWMRSEPGEHGYARPVEGLIVEFDLDKMAVVAVHDHGVVPFPPKAGNYDAARVWETMIDGKSVPGYPSLVVGLMTIGGVQLIMIGIVGEYIGKILSELKARPIYFVAEHSDKRADARADNEASERTAAE